MNSRTILNRRSDTAFREITALIYDGHFAPGERLPAEREFADTLHVSRPTLRDALNRLEARGFIDRRTGSGNYVCSVIPESVTTPIEDGIRENLVTLQQIIDVRKPLEIWATQQAACRHDKKQLAELRKALRAMQTLGKESGSSSMDRYAKADIQFHIAIAKMTGNPVYLHMLHFLTDLIRKSLWISRELLTLNSNNENTDNHLKILTQIAAGDPVAAGEAMSAHFVVVEERIQEIEETNEHQV